MALMGVGLGLVAVGLLQRAGDDAKNTVHGGKSEQSSHLGIMVAGVGVELVGAIISSGSKGILKKSMLRYNDISHPKTSFNFQIIPVNGKNTFGIGLKKMF